MWNKKGDVPHNFRKGRVMTATYAGTVLGFIQAEYAPLKHAAKLLARAAGSTPRAAENWLAGSYAPSGEALINLMARNAELRAEIDRLIEQRKTR